VAGITKGVGIWKTILLVSLLASGVAADRKKALQLLAEGRKIQAQAYTGTGGGFQPGRFLSQMTGGYYYRAIEKFDQAIKECPELAQAYAARSLSLHFAGENEAARADALKALDLGGLDERELILLGAPFQGSQARKVYRRCMKLAKPNGFVYGMLWSALAQTYWYEGNFRGQARELEALLAWKAKYQPKYIAPDWSQLGHAHEVSGQLAKAEAAFRKAGDGDSLVRIYLHQSRWDEARAALKRYRQQFEPDEIIVYAAGLDELQGRLKSVSREQLKAAHRLADGGTYYAFFLGLLQLRAGETEAGRSTLDSFCRVMDGNPREWGVTMAWEIRKARERLAAL